MLEFKKIGVTGRLATGKSLVCSFFKEHGAFIVNADEVVHQLLSSNQECIQKVIALLGNGVEKNGQIDRSHVAQIVFSNPTKLLELEKILHPQVFHRIKQTFENLKKESRYKIFVVEAPLLFEARWDLYFDKVVVVTADEAICKKRYQKTDYEQRISRMISVNEAKKRADFVLENNQDLQALRDNVKNIMNNL